jgi:aryl-alcohol dehydrogenase-like predicted oxidoreductase
MPIPLRNFGKTGVQISALGLGGDHLGGAKDEKAAIDTVHRALDGGITLRQFLGILSRQNRVVARLGPQRSARQGLLDDLMTKVCTHGRNASLATQVLEQSLRRLQTDHLDLWQIHGVVFQNDPELFIRPGGAADCSESRVASAR